MIVSMAWRNLWRHKRRTLLTAVTMAFSVMICIVMSGLTVGFLDAVRVAVVDRQIGHLQIHHADYPVTNSPYDTVPDASRVLAQLRSAQGVTVAAPRIQGFALFGGAGEQATTGMFMGVEPATEALLTGMDERITRGAWLSGNEPSVVIGYRLAKSLDLTVGDKLLVVANALDGSIGDRVYPVVGIYRTTNLALDEGAVLPLPVAQELLVLDDAIHEIVVLTDDADTVDEAQPRLVAIVGDGVVVRTWWEISPETLEMMAMQGATIGILAALILGIAGFIIINTLLMSVYERTREFGVMAAIGTRPRQIVGLVLTESFLLGTVSAVLGLVLGLGADAYLAIEGIRMATGSDEGFVMAGVVLEPQVYAVITADSVLVPVLTLFFVAVVGGLYPAMRAARLDPVTAIRQD